MISRTNKNEIRWRIHKRIRRKVRGTPERPRLAIFRSLSHIYAQIVDDTQGKTLVAAASSEEGLRGSAAASAPAPVEAAPAAAPEAAAPQGAPAKGGKGDKKPAKKAAPPVMASGGNVAGAKLIGKAIAERAKEKGIKQVVFDRGGYQYHGRVKALADAAREAGLEF